MTRPDLLEVVVDHLTALQREVAELRSVDIPQLKTEIAVMKNRFSIEAKLISGIGAALTLVASLLLTWYRHP